jgi:microcystin degradation protein MlrC
MRIAVAELVQETDSFSPLRAGLADFESYGLYRGDEILERMRDTGPIGGLLKVAAAQPRTVELVPLLRAWGAAGGPLDDGTFAHLGKELLDRLRAVLPVDAVFLSLHGAAAAESEDDVEGAVLAGVRQLVGDRVPVVVPLDHHANITRRMVAGADLLVGHETQPHDTVATGRKAARLLFGLLAGEITPVVAWQKIPMITPQDQFLTSSGPMKAWFDRARAFERQPGVLDVSPYPMQPWLDAAEGGWAVVVHAERDADLARRVAADMAALAWELRREFWRSERVAPAEAVRQAVAAGGGLVILSDTGDSVYGGAPGDGTCLLGELLAQRVPCLSLVPVVDAEAVAAAAAAGVPSRVTLPVGGRHDRVFSRPVELDGRVAALSEGVTAEIPDRGVCRVGRTALVECGAVRVVLLEQRSFAVNHPLLYTHLGIDVADARAVVVKTASNFQFFSRWRRHLIRVDTPGTTQSDLSGFHWQRLPRPIDPFEEVPDWQPDPQVPAAPGRRPADGAG